MFHLALCRDFEYGYSHCVYTLHPMTPGCLIHSLVSPQLKTVGSDGRTRTNKLLHTMRWLGNHQTVRVPIWVE